MLASLICIGNELLTGLIENSNSGYLARRLWSAGIAVKEMLTIADDQEAIYGALVRSLETSDLVIITGGLGPTDDDLTREVVASYLERELVLDKNWLKRMEHFFSARGVKMPLSNRKQALVVAGSRMLENEYGTAPGAVIEDRGKMIILLPGPPNEMTTMFDRQVLPLIVNRTTGPVSLVRTLKCIGIGESLLEEKIKAGGSWSMAPISYVARGFEVDLQIKGNGDPKTARQEIEKAEKSLRQTLGDFIYGSDDDTLGEVVASLLIENNKSLAVAESCSGGALSDLITAVAGSSHFFKGGLVAYSDQAKEIMLGIPKDFLTIKGAVSSATAIAMAAAARKLFQADYGLGITGLAGPAGNGSGKPVGLVYIAAAEQEYCEVKEYTFGGGRRAIKERSAQIALNLLRIMLLRLTVT